MLCQQSIILLISLRPLHYCICIERNEIKSMQQKQRHIDIMGGITYLHFCLCLSNHYGLMIPQLLNLFEEFTVLLCQNLCSLCCIIPLLPCRLCHDLPILSTYPWSALFSGVSISLCTNSISAVATAKNLPYALPCFPSRCFAGSCQLFWNTCCICGHFMVDIRGCMDSGFMLRRCLAFLPTISVPPILALWGALTNGSKFFSFGMYWN